MSFFLKNCLILPTLDLSPWCVLPEKDQNHLNQGIVNTYGWLCKTMLRNIIDQKTDSLFERLSKIYCFMFQKKTAWIGLWKYFLWNNGDNNGMIK